MGCANLSDGAFDFGLFCAWRSCLQICPTTIELGNGSFLIVLEVIYHGLLVCRTHLGVKNVIKEMLKIRGLC
jgi:hypothetical protein